MQGAMSLAIVVSGIPEIRDLHRFFIAAARAIVNDYGLGGTVFDPCVWSVGSLPKKRRVREGVQNYAMLLFSSGGGTKTEATCFSLFDRRP